MTGIASFENTLSTIAACGGAGAGIDFWLGKKGQKYIRSCVEDFWLRFSDVRLHTFGRQEAEFATKLLRMFFGTRLFSLRRISSSITITLVFMLLFLITSLFCLAPNHYWLFSSDLLYLALAAILFALSVSITIVISCMFSVLSGSGVIRNAIFYTIFLLIQYTLFTHMTDVTTSIESSIIMSLAEAPIRTYKFDYTWIIWWNSTIEQVKIQLYYEPRIFLLGLIDLKTYSAILALRKVAFTLSVPFGEVSSGSIRFYLSSLLGMLAAGIRLFLSMVFVISCFLRPFQAALLNVLERIVESDQPVFTLLFTGLAVGAKIIRWLVQHVL